LLIVAFDRREPLVLQSKCLLSSNVGTGGKQGYALSASGENIDCIVTALAVKNEQDWMQEG
jgi:hypothetical protein